MSDHVYILHWTDDFDQTSEKNFYSNQASAEIDFHLLLGTPDPWPDHTPRVPGFIIGASNTRTGAKRWITRAKLRS